MRLRNIATIATTCLFLEQGAMVKSAEAEHRDLPTATSGAVYSIIATIIGVPVKIATCTAMGVIGGVGHGMSLGESEFVQEEFLSGIPDACRPVLKTTPMDIDPYLEGPQPRDMAW